MQNKDGIKTLQYKYHALVLFMHTKKNAWWIKSIMVPTTKVLLFWDNLSTLLLPLKMELKIQVHYNNLNYRFLMCLHCCWVQIAFSTMCLTNVVKNS